MIDFDPEWWNEQRASLSRFFHPGPILEVIADIAGKSEKLT